MEDRSARLGWGFLFPCFHPVLHAKTTGLAVESSQRGPRPRPPEVPVPPGPCGTRVGCVAYMKWFLARITRFDLLGDFGRFNWLGNLYIVLSYNLLFAVVTTLCLVRKFTSAIREELLKALGGYRPHLNWFN
ncbi:hypothetical protein NHX12_021862 [Muraenolepis orangiensis]|uniref:Uncharacterized protein n=1 Tax=Muraenolepis orangiensis TaxID=630683 RepID=A0A9Q0EQW1_9TELE|nr:hypothetical protein NHX12_021862 [Muraenolepis orangiensis]